MKNRGASIKAVSILALLMTAILAASIILGVYLGLAYLWISILVLPLGYLIIRAIREAQKNKLLLLLRRNWGSAGTRETDPSMVGNYFRKTVPIRESEFVVDDRTWADLDMDLIFGRMNQTLTIPGEQVLYALLRTPVFSRKSLEERDHVINAYIQDRNIRERVQVILSKLGKSGGAYFVDLLWEEHPAPNKLAFLYPWLLLLIPTFLLLGLLGHSIGWFGFVALSLGHAVIHYRTKRKFVEDLPSIRYLGRTVKCAARLGCLRGSPLEAYGTRLRSALDKVSRIAPETALLSMGESNPLYEYLNILFLIEVRAFHSYLKRIGKYGNQLREIFEIIGFLDAMAAAASYKAGLKESVEPELTDSTPFLDIESIAHPLLENPVRNSVTLSTGGMLITGSNMSGKTTFLKTIGVNMLLAQSLHFCLLQHLDPHRPEGQHHRRQKLLSRRNSHPLTHHSSRPAGHAVSLFDRRALQGNQFRGKDFRFGGSPALSGPRKRPCFRLDTRPRAHQACFRRLCQLPFPGGNRGTRAPVQL